jgi:hypothetical protein
MRSTEQFVRFQRPFVLTDSERTYPAGAYRVITDEELIDGLSFLAYHRVSTVMFVPTLGRSSIEMITIDPADLEAAQRRDAAAHGGETLRLAPS